VQDDLVAEACIAERERLGQGLHDTVLQDLAAAKKLLEALDRQREPQHPSCEGIATHAIGCIDRALEHVRRITRGLCPVHIYPADIHHCLKQLCEESAKQHDIVCCFSPAKTALQAEVAKATHLYCIAREAVWNAIRHGGASEVTVDLQATDNGGSLTVSDNGCGLDIGDHQNKGLGLRIMCHRAQQMGGELQIAGNRDGGTTVVCTFV